MRILRPLAFLIPTAMSVILYLQLAPNQNLSSLFDSSVRSTQQIDSLVPEPIVSKPITKAQASTNTADQLVQSLDQTTLTAFRGPRVSDRFPDVQLIDHEGEPHRFLTDLVRDKTVCVVFFYTQCDGTCPGTTQLMQQLRTEISRLYRADQLNFISISLEPETDIPGVLKSYAQDRGLLSDPSLAPWYFCTGKYEELEEIRYALGLYDLDPEIDADKTEHAALITFGNDQYNRWVAMPAGIGLRDLKETFLRITGDSEQQRFSSRIRDDSILASATAASAPAGGCCHIQPASRTDTCCSSNASSSTSCCSKQLSDTDGEVSKATPGCCQKNTDAD